MAAPQEITSTIAHINIGNANPFEDATTIGDWTPATTDGGTAALPLPWSPETAVPEQQIAVDRTWIQPPFELPIPGTEEFHDFMCWLAGFTDPDSPPTQERWEAFQGKVREMAAAFFEYKKKQREAEYENSQPGLSMSASNNTAGVIQTAPNYNLGAGMGGNETLTGIEETLTY